MFWHGFISERFEHIDILWMARLELSCERPVARPIFGVCQHNLGVRCNSTRGDKLSLVSVQSAVRFTRSGS